MRCPFCKYKETKVVDSRLSGDGAAIRRRRECLKCKKRFTTYEYVEQVPLMVVKRDDRRQPFDRIKLMAGIIKACEKRPISMERIEEVTSEIERMIQKKYEREVSYRDIGEIVMEKLALLDDVAYVRFSSVYRQFKDVNQFMDELKNVLGRSKKKKKKKR